MLACAFRVAVGMVVGFLVERNKVRGVLMAECVPTAATVVFAGKVGEVLRTSRIVADDGFGVEL